MAEQMTHVGLDVEIELIIERLEQHFTDVAPSTVEAVVQQSVHQFDRAPVKSFLPLLAEKRARKVLQGRHF